MDKSNKFCSIFLFVASVSFGLSSCALVKKPEGEPHIVDLANKLSTDGTAESILHEESKAATITWNKTRKQDKDAKPENITVQYGLGVFTPDGTWKRICVNTRKTVETRPFPDSFSLHSEISLAETYDELAKSLNISVSGSVSGGVTTGSAKVDYLKDEKLTRNSLYIVFLYSASLFSEGIETPDLELLPKYTALLKRNTPQSRKDFNRMCGDAYIDTIKFGAEGYIVYKIQTESEEMKEALKADLSISGGTYNFDAKLRKSIEKIHQTKFIDIKHFANGPQKDSFPVDTDPQKIIDFIETFPGFLKGKNAVPLILFPKHYTHLIPDGVDEEDYQRYLDYLNALAPKDYKTRQIINELNYILSNPEKYIVTDEELKAYSILLRRHNTEWSEIQALIKECKNATEKCDLYYKPIKTPQYPKAKPEYYQSGSCKKSDTVFHTMYGGCRYMLTGTVWSGSPSAKVNYRNAKEYCEGSPFNGETGWRLPNAIDIIAASGAEKAGAHLNLKMQVNRFWTTDSKVANLISGSIYQPISTDAPYSVVCVRAERYTRQP